MIQQEERHEIGGETLEEGLYRKFGELQIAREDKSSSMFDEIAKSIEVRLIAVPMAHSELMKLKKAMLAILHQEKSRISNESENSIDVINRQKYLTQEGYEVEWEFRDIYEEQIMWIMQKYHLISMTSPMFGTLEIMKDGTQAEQFDEYSEEYQQPQDVQPPYKKPHLSIRV